MNQQELNEFIVTFAHEMAIVNQEMADMLKAGIEALPKGEYPNIFTPTEMAKHTVYSHLQAIVNDRLPPVEAIMATKSIINNLNQ